MRYRVSSDKKHVDFSILFKEIKLKVVCLISQVLQVQKALKVNIVVVCPVPQDTFSDKSFNTLNGIVSVGSDLNDIYQSFVEAMKAQSTEFQRRKI